MLYSTFDQIVEAAIAHPHTVRLAVAGEPNAELRTALDRAREIGLCEPVVFPTSAEAVAAVRSDDCDMLMKGSDDTKTFMGAILNKEAGLRSGKLISHCLVLEAHGKLTLITDGGICLNPSCEDKAEIIRNAVPIAQSLGIARPKVAVLAAVETVNPKMPETLDAEALSQLDWPDCDVQGPLAVDNAISPRAAEAKGIAGPVAGHADILLCPSVLAGNMFTKGIMYFANVAFGGIVAGTTKPVIFLSRSDTTETKFNTIALGVLLGFSAQSDKSST